MSTTSTKLPRSTVSPASTSSTDLAKAPTGGASDSDPRPPTTSSSVVSSPVTSPDITPKNSIKRPNNNNNNNTSTLPSSTNSSQTNLTRRNSPQLSVFSAQSVDIPPITTTKTQPQQHMLPPATTQPTGLLPSQKHFLNHTAIHNTNVSTTSVASAAPSTVDSVLKRGRFVVHDNGKHSHYLKSARRQEKLGGMLEKIMGSGKKVRDDAVSAIPDLGLGTDPNDPLSLMSGLVKQIKRGEADAGHVVKTSASSAKTPLIQKYGKCQEIIGKGAYGTVRVAHKFDHDTQREVLYAVKEFKRRGQESETSFSKRLTSEFCISSSLHDINIIHTLDLMKDARGEYCQVMEYCDGGDLYSLILSSEGGLKQDEADCFFKQLIRGVVYMHSMGVAHCDLKPENLLLTTSGVLKISDFGNAECFRMAWETEVHLSNGVCGSRPYIAPEQFREKDFDPRATDVWATGVIYMAMRTGSYLWQVAMPSEDDYYEQYLQGRKHKNGYEPIETLRRARCRNVIYSILDPSPSRRINAKQVLNSEWVRSICLCDAGERGY